MELAHVQSNIQLCGDVGRSDKTAGRQILAPGPEKEGVINLHLVSLSNWFLSRRQEVRL